MMTMKQLLLSFFSPAGAERPAFLPDLRQWYGWHRGLGTLPTGASENLEETCRQLGVPVWTTVRPWVRDTPGFTIESGESSTERTVTIRGQGAELTSKWTKGPDGDWWQTEYPVRSAEQLRVAANFVASWSYHVAPETYDLAVANVGDAGLVAVELPARPFSWLTHEMLGWADGLMLLLDEEDAVGSIVATADEGLQDLTRQLSTLRYPLYFSPDNLDGQFVSPAFFGTYLNESYRKSAGVLHENGGRLMAHAGGPAAALLPLLADAGVDGLAGVGARRHGDVTVADARAAVGPDFVLWGGISQEYLLADTPLDEFERTLGAVAASAAKDPHLIVGIADRLPHGADMTRLAEVSNRFR